MATEKNEIRKMVSQLRYDAVQDGPAIGGHLVARKLTFPSIQIDALSTARPVIFEVQMLNASGKPCRYRVLRNPPGRLIFEHLPGTPLWPGEITGICWHEAQSEKTRSTLVSVGGQAGLLNIDDLEAVKLSAPVDQKRLDSALFVSPKLAPCGSCGDWCDLVAEACLCGKDPRVIVEPCPRCDGVGEVMAESGNLLRDCPSCDGSKVEETSTGTARWNYLRRCVEARILTEEQAGGAIIEEA